MNAPEKSLRNYKSLEGLRVVKQTNDTHEHKVHFIAPPPLTRKKEGEEGHYRAYQPLPFTPEERAATTVLFGGLHWRAERMMQAALQNMGYNAEILPVATREDLMTGREVADIGQCCPTSFTTGALTNYLRRAKEQLGAEEASRRYVFLTAGACGTCRFGQYHHSYELALRNIGMDALRIFLLDQEKFDQGPAHGGGLDLNIQLIVGIFWGLIATDLVMDMEYQIRPYEVNPGETDRVARESIDYLHEVFRNRPLRDNDKKLGILLWHIFTDYFTDALAEVHRRFSQIEVDRLRVKPMVKITGEFFLQTVEGEPNYNIHRWLESEGAEVYPASIAIWIDYLWRLAEQDAEDHIGIAKGSRRKYWELQLNKWVLHRTYRKMRNAMGGFPRPMLNQYELRELSRPYFHSHMNGGEGDMLIGKALYTYHNKKAHMICELSPYSCMPNTMSVGAMAQVIGRYPDMLYAPLEIKGDSEVHALSRCQMILTEAKKRAQREYDEALQRTGLTEDMVREEIAKRPEMKKATYCIPHYGVSGTAANLVLHVAELRKA